LTDNDKQRPNANYKLSRSENAPPENESLNFRYSRERRLENAPLEVQNMYRDNKPGKFGLFASLVADRPRKILFAIIVLLCLLILVLTILGYLDTSYTLAGNKLSIKAIRNESNTINIAIIKTVNNKDAYTGMVEIIVAPRIKKKDEEYGEFPHRIYFTMKDEERYYFTVPFTDNDLVMVLQTDKGNIQIRLQAD